MGEPGKELGTRIRGMLTLRPSRHLAPGRIPPPEPHPAVGAAHDSFAAAPAHGPARASTPRPSRCARMRLTTRGSVTNPMMLASPPRGTRRRRVRAHLDVDPEHQSQQLRPPPPSRLERRPARLSLHHLVRRAARPRQHDAAPPPPHPPPRRVRPRVTHPHLVALRHVIHPARQELQRRHPVHPGLGAVAAVRDPFHLRPLGVVAQPRPVPPPPARRRSAAATRPPGRGRCNAPPAAAPRAPRCAVRGRRRILNAATPASPSPPPPRASPGARTPRAPRAATPAPAPPGGAAATGRSCRRGGT